MARRRERGEWGPIALNLKRGRCREGSPTWVYNKTLPLKPEGKIHGGGGEKKGPPVEQLQSNQRALL